MRRLLCWLGWHEWEQQYVTLLEQVWVLTICKHCQHGCCPE